LLSPFAGCIAEALSPAADEGKHRTSALG